MTSWVHDSLLSARQAEFQILDVVQRGRGIKVVH